MLTRGIWHSNVTDERLRIEFRLMHVTLNLRLRSSAQRCAIPHWF